MNNFRRLLLLGLKEEKYITLNGKCINTGIYEASDIKLETKAFVDNIYDVDFIIYCEDNTGNTRFSLLKQNNRIRTDYGSYMDALNTDIWTMSRPALYVKDRNKTYIDGELVVTRNGVDEFISPVNIYIVSPNSQYRKHVVFVYYVRIYKDDVLLLDLIPYNDTDMIDTLTGTIYKAN